MSLSRTAIRALRAETHRRSLKPVVMIGQQGLSEAVQNEIANAVTHHELIKIRLPALEKSDKSQLIEKICRDNQADLIQAIGHIIVIFRQNTKTNRFTNLIKQ